MGMLLGRFPAFRRNPTLRIMAELVRKDKTAMLSVAVLFSLVISAIFADYLAPYSLYQQELSDRFLLPSMKHLLGTDQLGRDILSRLIYGTRIIIVIIVATMLIAGSIGIVVGLLAGVSGGIVDSIIMRLTDILLAFPSLILALSIVGALGLGLQNAIYAVALAQIGPYARLVRSYTLSVKQLTYVENARALGAGRIRIMFRHILPNVVGPILVQIAFNVSLSLINVSALSFLGLGTQPPDPDWGTMICEGRLYIYIAPHLVIIPGLMLFCLCLAFNNLGETLRDALDPKLRALL